MSKMNTSGQDGYLYGSGAPQSVSHESRYPSGQTSESGSRKKHVKHAKSGVNSKNTEKA